MSNRKHAIYNPVRPYFPRQRGLPVRLAPDRHFFDIVVSDIVYEVLYVRGAS
jgi:hypothetical protein